MKNPYDLFGLPPDADESAVRKRYLELVRQHPPDRSPTQFAEIRAAYDELRDPAQRLQNLIFAPGDEDSLDDIIDGLRKELRDARIPVETLLSLGEE